MVEMSTREKLWHSMRQDLGKFVPEILLNQLLMCPCCGRFLPQENFDLEHIVPRQALADDPRGARIHENTPENIRAGTILLCKKPLKLQGSVTYNNGCNSWKGLWYDSWIREVLAGNMTRTRQTRKGAHHIVAMLAAGYLAMVHEYGYAAVLMESGLLMRKQFFEPRKFIPCLPIICQLTMLGGRPLFNPLDLGPWLRSFTFDFDTSLGVCRVGFRNSLLILPVSADPKTVRPTRLIIGPTPYALRPRFDVLFE